MNIRLTFLGAAGTVTGSKYLLSVGSRSILVDCGLFQGLKRLRERNWQALPFDPKTLHAVVLTHAHLDHTGYLPVLARAGFSGPVYCTRGTAALLAILLPDSARLQEEEAQFANRHGYSKHAPALPLYTQEDAEAALRLLRPVEWSASAEIAPRVTALFTPAGHVLGAASVLLEMDSARLLFSGDVGRSDDRLMRPPSPPPAADCLVIESTYGDRRHLPLDPETELGVAINRAAARGGVVVIPSFAVGRAQLLLLLLARLRARREIPDLPVFLNSPMATDVTDVYREHRSEHRLTDGECTAMSRSAHLVNTVEESKRLNTLSGPMIIVSASGMAAGGRVLHHLQAFAPDPRNLILFSGYQAPGTRGATLVAGADTVKIHGEWIRVRAEVVQLRGTSSHADCDQLVAWVRSGSALPGQIFVTHGEPAAADALRQQLRREFPAAGVSVAELGETVTVEGRSGTAGRYGKS